MIDEENIYNTPVGSVIKKKCIKYKKNQFDFIIFTTYIYII